MSYLLLDALQAAHGLQVRKRLAAADVQELGTQQVVARDQEQVGVASGLALS